MAKLGKRKFSANDTLYEFDLNYSSKGRNNSGQFYPTNLKYLQEVKDSLNIDFKSTNEEELIEALEEAYKKYWEINRSKRKVIIIYLGVSEELYTKEEEQGYRFGYNDDCELMEGFDKFREVFKKRLLADSTKYGLHIDYDVMYEVKEEGQVRYYSFHEDESLKDNRTNYTTQKSIVVDWSEKKIAFLEDVKKGMSTLAFKIMEFFFEGDLDFKLENPKTKLLN